MQSSIVKKNLKSILRLSLNMKLKIRIRDNGIGIRKEDQRHIFDKFYRAGKGDFKTVKGTGAGIILCKTDRYGTSWGNIPAQPARERQYIYNRNTTE